MAHLRIWLNRNYATTLHLINQLRNNPEGRTLTIYGSHLDQTSPMLTACDYRFTESALTGPAYADHALRFCLDHHIDVFLPVYEQHAITLRAARFRDLGVCLMAPGADAVGLLLDKAATYQAIGADADLVPPWLQIDSAAGFEAAVEQMREHGRPLVVKPVRGVGADGVHFLTEDALTLTDLSGPMSALTPVAEFARALEQDKVEGLPIRPWLVMPYLEQPEISVDVLAAQGRTLAAVPRSKVDRYRYLDAPAEVLEAASRLVARFGLDGLVNVQFRYWDGRPVLLEINARPSGGLYQTQLSQVNLPWAAVKLALGEPVPQLRPVLGARYVTVDTVVELGG